MNGIEATSQIKARCLKTKVLILTTYSTEEWILDAIRAGASGYLLKDAPREEVLKAIRGTVNEDKTFIDPVVAGKIFFEISNPKSKPSTLLTDKLTAREIEVLNLLARGFSNPDIADKLFLSEGTVRNYVGTIVEKLGVSDRTQAAILALEHGVGKT